MYEVQVTKDATVTGLDAVESATPFAFSRGIIAPETLKRGPLGW